MNAEVKPHRMTSNLMKTIEGTKSFKPTTFGQSNNMPGKSFACNSAGYNSQKNLRNNQTMNREYGNNRYNS